MSRPTAPDEQPPPRLATIAYATLMSLAAAWSLRSLWSYVAIIEYRADDFAWLMYGESLGRFAEHATSFGELFRPAFHVAYLFQYPLFGLDARPLAFALLLVWVLTAFVWARVFRAAGFDPFVAITAALIPLHLPSLTDSFFQVSFHGLTVSRLLIGLTLWAFLAGRSWRWYVPLLVVGMSTHEQYIAVGPIGICLLLWRDGWRGLAAGVARGGALRPFLLGWIGVSAVRVGLYLALPQETHGLTGDTVVQNLDGLAEIARARVDDRDLVLWVTAFGVAASGLAWKRVPRLLVVVLGASVAAYAPFVLAPYWTRYFGNVLVVVFALLPAWLALSQVSSDLRGGTLRRLRAVTLLAFVLVWTGASLPELQPRHALSFPRALAATIDPVFTARVEERPRERVEASVRFVETPAFREDTDRLLPAVECLPGTSYCPFFALLWPGIVHDVASAPQAAFDAASGAECETLWVEVEVAGPRELPWAALQSNTTPAPQRHYSVRLLDPPRCGAGASGGAPAPPHAAGHSGEDL
jgi:hypothetical protein